MADGQQIAFAPTGVESLKERIQGAVVVPGDTGYDDARKAWNLRIDQHPAVIVIAGNASDIAEAVRFAHDHGLGVSAQVTGHGLSRVPDGNLLILTQLMKAVQVDVSAQTARIEAGAIWADVLEAAQAVGLAPLLGSSPGVGVVGYTLGGGAGWLARKYGLATDSVRAFELVTADGLLRRASVSENNELFWGLRGGGGSFGVITAVEMQLYPVSTVYGGSLIYPIELVKEVFARYREWIKSLPEELTSSIAIMNFPDFPAYPEALRGRSVVMVRGCYCGPVEQGQAFVQPWRDWKRPLADQFSAMPFREVGLISNEPMDPEPSFFTGGVWLRDLDDTTVDTLVRYAARNALTCSGTSPLLITEVRHLAGAMARVAADTDAFGYRNASLLLWTVGIAPTTNSYQALGDYADQFKAALQPHLTRGIYPNFLERDNLFLIPLDGERRWYRYHHPFAEFLRNRLGTGRQALYQQAAIWCETHGFITESVNYALAARDFDRAVCLVEQHALALIIGGQITSAQGWLDALPPDEAARRPALLIVQAWLAMSSARVPDIEPRLQKAETLLAALPADVARMLRGEIAAVRALILGFFFDQADRIDFAEEALADLPQEQTIVRDSVLLALARTCVRSGDLAAAERTILPVITRQADPPRSALLCSHLVSLSNVREMQGRLDDRLRLCQQAVDLTRYEGQFLPTIGAISACAELGIALYERNELQDAEVYLRQSGDLARQSGYELGWGRACMGRARVALAHGDFTAAAELFQDADRAIHAEQTPNYALLASSYRVALWLRQGNLTAAARWADTYAGAAVHRHRRMNPFDAARFSLVHVWLAQHRVDEAVAELERLHREAATVRYGYFVMWSLAVLSLVKDAQGDAEAALLLLDQALALAELERYVRTIVDEGPPMAALLARMTGVHRPYAQQLLTAFGPDSHAGVYRKAARSLIPAQADVEPLSERELEVLYLIAAGLSNMEIADRLTVAVSTVKKHINSLYSKLDVQSRTQALVRGREMGLFRD